MPLYNSVTNGLDFDLHPGYHSGKYYPILGEGNAFTSGTGGAFVNTITYSAFYIAKTITIDRLCIEVPTGVTNSVARFGLYSNSNGLPANLILDAGEVNCSTTGSKEAIVNLTLNPGYYWFAIIAGTASPNLRLVSGSGFKNQSIYGFTSVSVSTSIYGYRQLNYPYGALPSIATVSPTIQAITANPIPSIRIA